MIKSEKRSPARPTKGLDTRRGENIARINNISTGENDLVRKGGEGRGREGKGGEGRGREGDEGSKVSPPSPSPPS